MKALTTKEWDQITEALRLAAIYMQENPGEETPIREVRLALQLMSMPVAGDRGTE